MKLLFVEGLLIGVCGASAVVSLELGLFCWAVQNCRVLHDVLVVFAHPDGFKFFRQQLLKSNTGLVKNLLESVVKVMIHFFKIGKAE